MYTALRATSLTLAEWLRQRLQADPNLAPFFDPASGGTMVVSLNTPEEMGETDQEGLSVWLYRIVRDEQRLNAPQQRIGFRRLRHRPLPLRLHYLVTPIIEPTLHRNAPELEQTVLGKVLQCFHDHPTLRGADLQNDLAGTTIELAVRLETQSVEEITRVWDALERSYQLCLSYEVSVVNVDSALEDSEAGPVEAVLPEFGVAAGLEAAP